MRLERRKKRHKGAWRARKILSNGNGADTLVPPIEYNTASVATKITAKRPQQLPARGIRAP